MKFNLKQILGLGALSFFITCSHNNSASVDSDSEKTIQNETCTNKEPHQYGGWYCPDNLNGFPAVDIANWKNVPVVNGRMPTVEEARNGTSLIYVDSETYPDAKVLPAKMPRLAKIYNENVNREDLIIVIQAFTLQGDSIVGFRYLNGGNGSARLNEITLLTETEINALVPTKFVSLNLTVNAGRREIWEVLTDSKYLFEMEMIFNSEAQLEKSWRLNTNFNYAYHNAGKLTAKFSGDVFGNAYIQNDYEKNMFTEKILLIENHENKTTEVKVVFGPFENDYDEQKAIIEIWANKVKELSEGI